MLRVAHLSNEQFGGVVVALAYDDMRGAQLLNLKFVAELPGIPWVPGSRTAQVDSQR